MQMFSYALNALFRYKIIQTIYNTHECECLSSAWCKRKWLSHWAESLIASLFYDCVSIIRIIINNRFFFLAFILRRRLCERCSTYADFIWCFASLLSVFVPFNRVFLLRFSISFNCCRINGISCLTQFGLLFRFSFFFRIIYADNITVFGCVSACDKSIKIKNPTRGSKRMQKVRQSQFWPYHPYALLLTFHFSCDWPLFPFGSVFESKYT